MCFVPFTYSLWALQLCIVCLFVVVVFFFLPECLLRKSSSARPNSPSESYPWGTRSSALESRLHPYPRRPHPALIWTLLGQFSHQNFLFSCLFFLSCNSLNAWVSLVPSVTSQRRNIWSLSGTCIEEWICSVGQWLSTCPQISWGHLRGATQNETPSFQQ